MTARKYPAEPVQGENAAEVFTEVGLPLNDPSVAAHLASLDEMEAESETVALGHQERVADSPDGDW